MSGSAPWDRLGISPSPAPAQRLRAEPLWDEATRPRHRGPSDASYSARGRAVARHLLDVHDHLRSELDRVRSLIDQVRQGTLDVAGARSAISEMTLRQNNWTLGAYCASYCRVVTGHHGLEDEAIFPHLRDQEAGLAPVIDRLAAEHDLIHEVLEAFDRALVGLVGGAGALEMVQRAADALTDALLSHLAYEESELLEPLARHGFYPGQL